MSVVGFYNVEIENVVNIKRPERRTHQNDQGFMETLYSQDTDEGTSYHQRKV